MKTYTTENNGKKIKIEVLSIDEAKKKNRLTKEEADSYHVWHKNENNPVDNKHIVYAFNVLPNNPETDWVVIKWFSDEPNQQEVIDSVIAFDNI
ncbi:hypothetical protein EG359_17375 [Chryseobacterium joostei]|uniref:Uncharacterized protein n=1 Tax=Chryseobacterium joostei TaxID=112234 RepID=A0A1N7IB19_9FLAO|nr:hypothetical protein [Chryseobacterium joostei]AZB01275.1 hypothetical protein EG359_17375 [Chryseobacterium joostei]SIS34265.1 hypothetical protein SAMN05421768_103675 [Chryseobacterium joostei]